jgi:bacterioferritin-associated ferredoxin
LKGNFKFVQMIVCLCHPATERDVESCIREGARSVDDIGDMCGAGTGCGACRDDLRERLERAGIGGESDRPRDCQQGYGTPGLVRVRSRQAA